MITGAMPQQPRHRQASRLNRPSGVQPPPLNAQLLLEQLIDVPAALHIAGGAQADADVVAALGGEAEHGVEGGDAVNFAQRLAQLSGHEALGLHRQEAVDLLGLLQGRQGHTGLVPVLREPRPQLPGSGVLRLTAGAGFFFAHSTLAQCP